jgi:hypothetical protein
MNRLFRLKPEATQSFLVPVICVWCRPFVAVQAFVASAFRRKTGAQTPVSGV